MTQHNVFVRKFGDQAIVMTVTDWEDFKELEQHIKKEGDSDFLLSAVTTKSIFTNMQPSMLIATSGEVKNISSETKGAGLGGILTGDSLAGPIWSFRKIKSPFGGLYSEE